jgi:hypothetical protein
VGPRGVVRRGQAAIMKKGDRSLRSPFLFKLQGAIAKRIALFPRAHRNLQSADQPPARVLRR